MKHTKVLVFDLYNTLVEIQRPTQFFVRLYRKSTDGFHLSLKVYLHLLMTTPLNDLKQQLPTEFSYLLDEHLPLLTEELNSVMVYPEVHTILKSLKEHYSLYLVSNLASPYKKNVSDSGLDVYFDHLFFSCDCGFLKPDKRIFQLVEQHAQMCSSEVTMIGDSLKADVQGAYNMQWNVIRIDRKNAKLTSGNYPIVKSLEEIEKRLS